MGYRSAEMMDLLKAIHRRRNAFQPCLELERQKLRIMARLVQVTTMEPKRLLLGRLPHVSLLAFPRSWIFGRIRAEAPDLANLVGDLLGNKVRFPAVHRAVAGGVDDKVGWQVGPIAQDDGMLRELCDIDTAFQFDASVGDQLRSANIDVVSRPTSQILHEQA